ncbi:hypothetical protein SRHO_G00253710 [Serrasalmus rhombeus]
MHIFLLFVHIRSLPPVRELHSAPEQRLSLQVKNSTMDWRIILAVLCLIEGCALQTTNTTSPSSSPPTSDNGTQSSPSPPGNGSQSSPSPSGNGSQPSPSPPRNGSQPSPSPPGNGSQTSPSPPGNGSQPSPSPPGNGSQPSPSPPGNGTQSTPSGNGTSPTSASLQTPFFRMSFSSPDTFTPDLDDINSAAFKKRADTVKRALEFYLNRLPNFLRLDVLKFRSGSVITDTAVVFNANATLPDPANITSTLKDAANNASLGFNITADSINVSAAVIPTQASPVDATSTQASSNVTIASASNATTAAASRATTAAASSATTAAASNAATAAASNATTAAASNATSASPSNATTSISTTAPAVAAKFNVSFSISDTFDSNLSNSNSDQFQARSKIIISQLQPFFVKAFKNFIRMFIWRFRSGSILVDSTLDFNSSASIPSVTQLRDTLVTAFKSGNLNFTADPNSINITQTLGNSMAPRMAGSLPLLFMSLISLLLSFALHF